MKFFLVLTYIQLCISLHSQTKLIKRFTLNSEHVEIDTKELDEIKILNSENTTVEIDLLNEDSDLYCSIDEKTNDLLTVKFQRLQASNESGIFRKFITERIRRASLVIKIPKNKVVTILGTNVDVISESYQGQLKIYIDKGYVNLNTIVSNVELSLFQGNVYGEISKATMHINSTNGVIKVDERLKDSPFESEYIDSRKSFKVSTINANIFMTTNK